MEEKNFDAIVSACEEEHGNNPGSRPEDGQIWEEFKNQAQAALDKIIDIDSFVSMYILHEIACDPDVGYSSFYLSFDASEKGNKKMTLNCPWDWDSAFGIRKDTVESGLGIYAANSSNPWLYILTKAQWFMNKVAAKWNQVKEANLFTKAVNMVNDYSTSYNADYNRNFQKWPHTMGNNYETNFEIRESVKKFTQHTQCTAQLVNWFNTRISDLDKTLSVAKEIVDLPAEMANFKKSATSTRYEAETSNHDGTTKTKPEGENISGTGYVGDLDGQEGKKMTFTVNSSKATKALLSCGLSARTDERTFSSMFRVTVNGEEMTEIDGTKIPAGTSAMGPKDYHYWTTKDIGFIDLKAGENTIVLTSTGACTNFDYLDVFVPNNYVLYYFYLSNLYTRNNNSFHLLILHYIEVYQNNVYLQTTVEHKKIYQIYCIFLHYLLLLLMDQYILEYLHQHHIMH